MSAMLRFNFKTRNGKEIPVHEIMEIPENLIRAVNNHFRNIFGINNERRQADEGYNCHGMTFIGKLGWIGCSNSQKSSLIISKDAVSKEDQKGEEDVIEKVLKGNGLNRSFRLDNYDIDYLKGDEDVDIGDVVVYKDKRGDNEEILHTAIVTEIIKLNDNISNLKVLSKMGYGGEYFHFFNNAPKEFGKIIEVWTDREKKE